MKLTRKNLTKKLGYTSVQADWYLKMMVQIVIDEDGTVNARKLHEVLGSKRKFADWIKQRIEKYGFIEDVDYFSFSQICEKPNGGRPTTEYKLTVNMAKELSMIENNEQGREFRKYFIMAEEIANKVLSWKLERAENIVVYKEMKETFIREYYSLYGKKPHSKMFAQLQNDIYWIVFGVQNARGIKDVLEIKGYESIPDNVIEQIEQALTYVYRATIFFIEMGKVIQREERCNEIAKMFDKKFGGHINLEAMTSKG